MAKTVYTFRVDKKLLKQFRRTAKIFGMRTRHLLESLMEEEIDRVQSNILVEGKK